MNETLEKIYIHEVMDLGIERGLTVVMDPLLDDYFYSIMPIVGWKASRNDITLLFNKSRKQNSDL